MIRGWIGNVSRPAALAALMLGAVSPFYDALAKEPKPRAESVWGLHFDLHPNAGDTSLGADISEDNIRDLLSRVKPDYVQYDCKGHAGYLGFPSERFTPSPGIVNDSLAVWRKVTRESGVGLFIHFSGVWDGLAAEQHPEWAVVKADGSRDDRHMSFYGPYVDERMIPQLKEAVEKYDLDGLWVDGECWAAQFDYSPAALERWREETGLEEAPKGAGDPHWQEWKTFHRKHFERYLTHWIGEMHRFRPDLQITSNWMYTTFAPKPVEAPVDFISGDYTYHNSLYQVRLDARYLENTGMPWDLMAWGFHRGDNQGWTLKPAAQLQQEAAAVLSRGGGFQIYNQPTRSGYIVEPMIETLAEVGEFVRAHEAAAFKSESVPQVALLLSTQTYLHKSDRVYAPWGGEYNAIRGALDALIELGYSADVLAEHQLESRMDEYPLIVLPSVSVMDDAFREKLLDRVRGGGSLLLLGAETARLFEPWLGAEIEGEHPGGRVELQASNGVANANGAWLDVEANGAEVIAKRFPTRDTRKDGKTAATLTRLGEGRLAAVYGPVAERFYDGHAPQLRQFFGDVVGRLYPGPAVEILGPPWLEISLRETADGRLSLHLLNVSQSPNSDRFGFADYIPPIGPVQARIQCPDEPRKVELIPSGTRVEWTWEEGELTALIPQIPIYEILVID